MENKEPHLKKRVLILRFCVIKFFENIEKRENTLKEMSLNIDILSHKNLKENK